MASGQKPAGKGKRRFRWGRAIFLTILLGIIIVGGTGVGFVLGVIRDMPPLEQLEQPKPSLSSTIYDKDGNPIKTLHGAENRNWIRVCREEEDAAVNECIPLIMQQAVIAIEDHEFYSHFGINPRGIARAAWSLVTTRSISGGGGSTLTQQLMKNLYLTPDQTFRRKLQDMWYAIQLERRYTKPEILEMYLNWTFFGHNAAGVQAAAQTYFGKDIWEVSVAEAAMLAGVPQLPSTVNPFDNFERATFRQRDVLTRMEEEGYLTEAEGRAAREENLLPTVEAQRETVADTDTNYFGAHFIDYVTDLLLAKYDADTVYQGGLHVYTTFDPEAQEAAEEAVKLLDEPFPMTPGAGAENVQAAVVVMEAQTGYVKALVGGRTREAERGFNRAIVPAQPGSTIKPLAAYTPALHLRRVTPGTVIDDAPYFPAYMGGNMWPNNWRSTETFEGLMTVRKGLSESVNVLAVKVMEMIGGPGVSAQWVKKFGVTTLVEDGPNSDIGNASFVLGGLTRGISPLELTGAYSTFANLGDRSEPLAILKVVDKDGIVLEQNEPRQHNVTTPQVSWLMNSILKDAVYNFTVRAILPDGRPVAGKTGSTDNFAEVWFAGYTPDVVTVVWVGHDDHQYRTNFQVDGGHWQVRVWNAVMSEVVQQYEPSDWERPGGLVAVSIDRKSGKRPGPWTPAETIYNEWFLAGTEPSAKDDVHTPAWVVKDSDPAVLYNPLCPNVEPELKSFIRRHEEWKPSPRGTKPLDAAREIPRTDCMGTEYEYGYTNWTGDNHNPPGPPPGSTGPPAGGLFPPGTLPPWLRPPGSGDPSEPGDPGDPSEPGDPGNGDPDEDNDD